MDTAALVGHLVPAGSVYPFLAEHRGQVFPDGLFADLFLSGRGRPSVPGEVIASVLALQTLQDYSDAEAMQALRCDLRWKVACGLPIDQSSNLEWRAVGEKVMPLADTRRECNGGSGGSANSPQPARLFDPLGFSAVIVATLPRSL